MIKRAFRLLGNIMLGSAVFLIGLNYALNMNVPSIERKVTEKSKTISWHIKNGNPKKILYLVSADFEKLADYERINKNFKSKLEVKHDMFKAWEKPSQQELSNLERIIDSFKLDKKSFLNHLGDLNLVDSEPETYGFHMLFIQPWITRKNEKDCEVYLYKFKNKKEFFNILSGENIKNIDEVIITAHGKRSSIICDKPESFSEWVLELNKTLNPENYVTTLDIRFMPEKKMEAIRSKLNDNAVIYLFSCEALRNSNDQTTIAEALSYLFQKPVIASDKENCGMVIDAHPYDKIDVSKPETIKDENVSYKSNFIEGNWFVIYPKDNQNFSR